MIFILPEKFNILIDMSSAILYIGQLPDQWLWSLRTHTRADLAIDIGNEIRRALHTRPGQRQEASEAGRRMTVKIFCSPPQFFVFFICSVIRFLFLILDLFYVSDCLFPSSLQFLMQDGTEFITIPQTYIV